MSYASAPPRSRTARSRTTRERLGFLGLLPRAGADCGSAGTRVAREGVASIFLPDHPHPVGGAEIPRAPKNRGSNTGGLHRFRFDLRQRFRLDFAALRVRKKLAAKKTTAPQGGGGSKTDVRSRRSGCGRQIGNATLCRRNGAVKR